jgi:hypothetical protein
VQGGLPSRGTVIAWSYHPESGQVEVTIRCAVIQPVPMLAQGTSGSLGVAMVEGDLTVEGEGGEGGPYELGAVDVDGDDWLEWSAP